MRAFGKMVCAVSVLFALIFMFANFIMMHWNSSENGRPHRVEINRVAYAIEQNGFQNVDLSQCEYVYCVEKCGEDFYDSASDYSIREIDGELYRFDYIAKSERYSRRTMLAVNIILAVVTAAVFALLLYIRAKILRPFERLTNVPYELSRGNLTIPL